jgi:alkanesulfonate monooxygenase SsuD/methylene tetrahydromethanopterin reductase-like flavin-dependent oxidoreductase (luciferase family)
MKGEHRMRLAAIVSDGHAVGVDPRAALAADVALVGAVRDRLDGIVLHHGWATAPRWNLQALTAAAYLASVPGPPAVTIRGLPLGVRNPVELAEQLATVDHAWGGRLHAGLAVGTAAECAAFGIDPALAAPRLEEGVGLMRGMWADTTLSGPGPQYVFGEVRPTLRAARVEGPALSLGVSSVEGAGDAARLGLGLHVVAGAPWEALLEAYRAAGGTGDASTELDAADASAEALGRLDGAGLAQVDVRVRAPGDAPEAVEARLAALAGTRAA